MSIETVNSLQNAGVKNAVHLREKSRERSRQQLFPVEGKREIQMAVSGGYSIDTLYLCPDLGGNFDLPAAKTVQVGKKVFEKMAYRENPDGALALIQMKDNGLQDVKLSDNPFIIVLESVEKPGNLGAVLRTADAAAVDAVIVCDPACDIFNPNVIRSSLGCVFVTGVAVCSSDEALQWLKNNNIRIFAAELEASKWHSDMDYTAPSAIVMGKESTGLSRLWIDNAHERVKIPMKGKIDSLNVSVSTAIITFEALRQRYL
ncbi:MAG: RNA methyltransferase [Prevotellaceae bacterium]|jgi:TrmH family RNA methyltransferase|nr:RNA methyltransferase [Prevotellaceae bacterium]